MAKIKSVLNYPRDYYLPSSIELANTLTEKEARQEYSRLRAIAKKRLARFESAKMTDTETYKNNINRFPPLSELTPSKLHCKLSSLAYFLESPLSTVSGQRERESHIISKLEESGIHVSRETLKSFGDFMEEWRQQTKDSEYSSDQMAKLFDIAQEKRIPIDLLKTNIEKYAEKKEALENMTRKRSGKKYSSKELERQIRNYEKRSTSSHSRSISSSGSAYTRQRNSRKRTRKR